MTMRKTVLATGLATLALLGSAASAWAASAYTTTNINVRSGPGTSYSAVDVLAAGTRVEIDRCSGSWCLVYNRGVEGWVSANYLDNDSGYRGGSRGPEVIGPVNRAPSIDFDINIGPSRPYYAPPPRPHWGYGPPRGGYGYGYGPPRPPRHYYRDDSPGFGIYVRP